MKFSSMISISFIIIFIKHHLSLWFWYTYIIFLILIGGLLVLFLYMTSIASNEKFKTIIFLFSSMSMVFFSTMEYIKYYNLLY